MAAKRHFNLDINTVTSTDTFDIRPTLTMTAERRTEGETAIVTASAGGVTSSNRRDRRSPVGGCKRPMAIGLPKLDLTRINESAATPATSHYNDISSEGAHIPVSTKLEPPTPFPSTPHQQPEATDMLLTPSAPSVGSVRSTSGSDQPTNILPFLFLGSQRDALSEEVINSNRIQYVINVSTNSPQSPYVAQDNFLRIPVNDSHSDRLLPFFHDAFRFLDAVRESSSGCVLVHCLAGISRSPTLVIAYVMHHLGLSTDDAYRYVKDRRPSISPNFNFLGQLIEFESQRVKQDDSLAIEIDQSVPCLPLATKQPPRSAAFNVSSSTSCSGVLSPDSSDEAASRAASPVKRPCFIDVSRPTTSDSPAKLITSSSSTSAPSQTRQRQCTASIISSAIFGNSETAAQSPTTAMSKLNFDLQAVGNRSTKAIIHPISSVAADMQNIVSSSTLRTKASTVMDFSSTSATISSGSADLVGAASYAVVGPAHGQLSQHHPSSFTRLPPASVTSSSSVEQFELMSNAGADSTELPLLWQHVQQACKSRSFEDILMLSSSSTTSSGSEVSTSPGWAAAASRRGRRSDANDNGSASPMHGGHDRGGSLHGSLELIQVS